MMYEVTYQVGGHEHTDRVDAHDAASAEAAVREARGHSADMFELLLVHLVEADVDAQAGSAERSPDDNVAVGA